MIVSVAVNVRAFQLFDYAAPAKGLLGRRVRVSFRNKTAMGIVMEERKTSAAPANIKIKPLLEVDEVMPPLPAAVLDLIRFCADYYHAPIGVAAAAAIPAVFRRSSKTVLANGYAAVDDNPPSDENARKVWTFLRQNGCQTAAIIHLETGVEEPALRRMCKKGALTRGHYWPPSAAVSPTPPPVLTDDQKNAVEAVKMNDGYAPYLLFGDTGAGKTEVYLQLAQKALAAGGQALVLTPEIHLTPQLESSFAERFPDKRLCVMHSALTDGERARRWLMAREGAADVVLGTRSAVFAPLPDLRLIVVDEEHDDSYKQGEGLLFSARDVAVWRARREKTTLVCGSATPSLESYENARRRRYHLLRMNARARQGHLKAALAPETGALFHGMSQQFLGELSETLSAGGQALVFINRRGYSPMLACRRCEWAAACEACESRMTWHMRRGQLLCHRCGNTKVPPPTCAACGGPLAAKGAGTQRIEEALNARFAPLKAIRLDGDSLSRRDSFAELRKQIVSGEARLLVGTQIVAKGHDFPKLSFIGVLNADAGLWSADFRAEERLLMLLRQVIGRGTRNTGTCRVLIQTAYPDHPFYRDLLADDLRQCWKRLSEERRRMALPPFSHCALLRASSPSESQLRKFFSAARNNAGKCAPNEVRFFDPVPSPVAKVAGRFRWQLMAQSASRARLHQFLTEWRDSIVTVSGVRWSIDVDPSQI